LVFSREFMILNVHFKLVVPDDRRWLRLLQLQLHGELGLARARDFSRAKDRPFNILIVQSL